MTLSLWADEEEKMVLRVGHFPTITHAQGLIGHGLTRQNKGWFERWLGPHIDIHWYVYNDGPSAMEAIFAESIDILYVGPNPAINAFIKSKGKLLKIVCGSCNGGASFVVQKNLISKLDDLNGKKIATPQFGSTQDIAARAWLKSQGFDIGLTKGDVMVIPTSNASAYALFKQKDIDGVWTVEPWVSRLILEANGQIFFKESELWAQTNGLYATTALVSSQKFLKKQPEIVKKWIKGHIALTNWMKSNPQEAKKEFNQELKAEIMKGLEKNVLERAWSQIEFTYELPWKSLLINAKTAFDVGFLKEKPNIEGIYDPTLLNEVLNEITPIPSHAT